MTDLLKIPGVGENMRRHLRELGYRSVEELRGQDPEEMYQRDCTLHQEQLDRCVLYVYRTAVYFAENDVPDPEKLKWWNWKD